MTLLEDLIIHDELNPDLYSNKKLKKEVRDKILEVVDYFINDYIEFKIPVLDIVIVGSNASYNYTPQSDIDIHIITNFAQFIYKCNEEVLRKLYDFEKAVFNKSYDIQIKGRQVEIYVENLNTSTVSNGIYSVFNDKWIKFPSPIVAQEYDTSKKLGEITTKLMDILVRGDKEEIENAINALYIMRKNALATEGEYGEANQLFKDIRNSGILSELKDKLRELISNDLSLESLDIFKYGTLY